MQINPSIFKGYDIRGIYPTDYNEENIKVIVKALYTFFSKDRKEGEELRVVVGEDMRTSSPQLKKAAVEALLELGAHVIDIGLVSTPTFYFAVSHYGYECGFQVTASHNPKEWNGMKMVKNSPNGLIKIGRTTGLEEVKEIALSESYLPPAPGGVVEKKEGVLEEELDNALKIAGNPDIKEFKIVADAANAMGAQYIEKIFERIPGNLIKMNFDLDGTFPAHQPDPLQPENLKDLQERVVQENADFGLAPDGDGDRLFFIDEKGQIVPPTSITSIIAEDMLKNYPTSTFLVDIRYILTPKKIIEENGGKVEITKVGHAFITEAMHKTGAIFAGESSSHFFFKDTGNAESEIAVILMILKILSRENVKLSELVAKYRRSFESGEFNFKVTDSAKVMEAIKEKYQDGTLNTLDGVSIDYEDWRFSVRTSNTEPLLRLNVEALTKELMEQKRDEIINIIEGLK